jgi:hypothetical protein
VIVQVECTADRHGDPLPSRLHLDSRIVDLVRIHDVWPGADHTYVKAEDGSGTTWILRHDRTRDQWEVTMYSAVARVDPT